MDRQKSISKKQYATISAQLLYDKNLNSRQKILMAVVSNLSNEKGFCWASNSYLAAEIGCSISTLKRDIATLLEYKYIKRKVYYKANKTVDYRSLTPSSLVNPPPSPSVNPPQSNTEPTPQFTSEPYKQLSNESTNGNNKTKTKATLEIPIKYKDNQNRKTTIGSRATDETYFNLFWKQYPNKISKAKAKSLFLKQPVKEQKQIVLKSAKYKIYRPFPNYHHAHPTTYLNQVRWHDELPNEDMLLAANTLFNEVLKIPEILNQAAECLHVHFGEDKGQVLNYIACYIGNTIMTINDLKIGLTPYLKSEYFKLQKSQMSDSTI